MSQDPDRGARALAYVLTAASLLAVHGATLAQETYARTTLRASSIQAPNPAAQWGVTTGGSVDQSNQLDRAVSSRVIESFGYNSSNGGFAHADALAWAEPGAVGASAAVEVQARAQPNGDSGGDGTAAAKAYFTDRVTFTAANQAAGALLRVSGALLLTGVTFSDRASVAIWGSGTGLNLQQPNNTWRLFCNGNTSCIYTDAYSNRIDWTSGTPILVPYQFFVQNGVAARVEYTMDVSIHALVYYLPCIAVGGLCPPGQFDTKIGRADFSHTLAWGGATVTTANGGAVGAFSATGLTGFDYSQPYAPVPEPAAWALMLAGLMFVLRRGAAALT